MPLEKSASKEAVGRNIKEMEKAGHSHEQSVAAALHNQDSMKHHHSAVHHPPEKTHHHPHAKHHSESY